MSEIAKLTFWFVLYGVVLYLMGYWACEAWADGPHAFGVYVATAGVGWKLGDRIIAAQDRANDE